MFLPHRPRRNRKSVVIREMVQETHLRLSDLILPLFVLEGQNLEEPISAMPGVSRYSLDRLMGEVENAMNAGIFCIDLFPVISSEKKDAVGSEALNPQGLIPETVYQLKKRFPTLCIMTDIALDPYTSHGHDGVLNEIGDVANDESVEILTKMSLMHAQAGVDMVAPSDMMDGRVSAIRKTLDLNGYQNINIHAYSAKYASCLYGPFREALHTPRFGNKKSYQLNPANIREALRESALDEEEGADILMVKPAMFYLDVIAKLRQMTNLPISAYQVSGEYAMIMAASEKGWVDGDCALLESLLCIKRAGADMIITYGAVRAAELIRSSFEVNDFEKRFSTRNAGACITKPCSHSVAPYPSTATAKEKV